VGAAEELARRRARKADAREGVVPGSRSRIDKWKVEVMHNLVHNRRLIVGLVVAILVAAAIVLLVAYSGGGSGGGVY
jgi:hypothetical protein